MAINMQRSITVYWIICGISFTCDTAYASVNGYTYIKTMILMLLFDYCMMRKVGKHKVYQLFHWQTSTSSRSISWSSVCLSVLCLQSVSVNNALLRNASRLTDLERHPRKWVADEQSQYELAFEHITSDKVSCDQTTLNSLQTVPKESVSVVPCRS